MRVITDEAEKHAMSREQINLITLSFEEIFVNIMNYGYQKEIGDVEMVYGKSKDGEFIIKIIDSGIPFNMLSAKDPDIEASLEDRSIGGLGIHLVKKLMKDVEYTRDANRNVLTIGTGFKISDVHQAVK